jgi:Ca2+-binding RTX toxin-like protein
MNESYWLHDKTFINIYKFESATHPDYLQAGWDDRFLFGTDGVDDVLRGEDAPGGGAKNNVLVGFGGDDTLIYGEGNDNLFGGDGNDSLIIDTEHHNGFLDSYALTGFVIPTVTTRSRSELRPGPPVKTHSISITPNTGSAGSLPHTP